MIRTGDAAIHNKKTTGNGGWTQEVGSGNAQAIAAGGSHQFVPARRLGGLCEELDRQRRLGSRDRSWNRADGNGTQLFLRNDSAVFATNFVGGAWTQETDPGSASSIAAG
jgi:hypothetical protein